MERLGARLQSLYRTMARIRAFEEAAEAASQGGCALYGQEAIGNANVKGPLHLSIGQEAVAAGVCAHLKPSDYLTSTHRGHGHTLAKGADMGRMMCELFGKSGGFNGGRGGSMHIADFSVGMLGSNGVVAAGLPIAVGAAHAQKLQNRPDITACFFGDGAINRGPFLEALNWAQIYQLPVLLVCEDNRWSATTSTDKMSAGPGPTARAQSLGIPAVSIDGNDVLAVYDATETLVAAVRQGLGPRLLHARTYRVKGHTTVDRAAYRDPDQLGAALMNDPLKQARERYLQLPGTQAHDLQTIDHEAGREVAMALEMAERSPFPAPQAAFEHVQTTGAGQWR